MRLFEMCLDLGDVGRLVIAEMALLLVFEVSSLLVPGIVLLPLEYAIAQLT